MSNVTCFCLRPLIKILTNDGFFFLPTSYPKIFESLKGFKKINFKSGFSEREFNSKMKRSISVDKHPFKKFSVKYKNWEEYFKYSKNKNSLKDFYNNWNKEYNENILETLYSVIKLDEFYVDNNLQTIKLSVNKEISELNRFRQSN